MWHRKAWNGRFLQTPRRSMRSSSTAFSFISLMIWSERCLSLRRLGNWTLPILVRRSISGLPRKVWDGRAKRFHFMRKPFGLDRKSGRARIRRPEPLLPGARLLLLMGRLEDAEQWIRDALKTEPNLRDCHYEFARLLMRKGDAIRAAEEGEAALRLGNGETKDTQIHYLLIRAYGPDRPAAAARHAEALRQAEKTAASTPH